MKQRIIALKFCMEHVWTKMGREQNWHQKVIFFSISNSLEGISILHFVFLLMMMSSASDNKIFFDFNHQKPLGWEVSRC